MNLEKISQPINSKSVEEHEGILWSKLEEVGLEYVDRLLNRKIKPMEDDISSNDLGSLLERYTNLIRSLVVAHKEQDITDLGSGPFNWKDGEYENLKNIYLSKILEFYNQDKDSWKEKTLSLLKEEKEKAEAVKRNIPEKETEEMVEGHDLYRSGRAGIINFTSDIGVDLKKMFSGTDFGLKEDASYMSLHLESLFKQHFGKNDKNIFSDDSLSKLAVKIVKEYPETEAIVGLSWVMDTPIAKRVGFHVYKRFKYAEVGMFWGQFVDSKGQIDQGRVKKFLETGEAPYQIAVGAIKTEDFLKKYLPKEFRGNISLKELNPEFDEKKYQSEYELIREMGRNWDIMEEKDIMHILYQCSFAKEFNETNDGKGFIDFFFRMKKEKKTSKDLEKEPELNSYKKAFDEFHNNIKFINKEVVVD